MFNKIISYFQSIVASLFIYQQHPITCHLKYYGSLGVFCKINHDQTCDIWQQLFCVHRSESENKFV